MHRVLNVKHRIVRRTVIGRAPLATFDTIDLGDEDNKDLNKKNNEIHKCINQEDTSSTRELLEIRLCDGGISQSRTIGGNHSKKALSQSAGEGKEEKGADLPPERDENYHNTGDNTKCDTSPATEEKISDEKEGTSGEKNEELLKSPIKECKEDFESSDSKNTSEVPLSSAILSRQGTLGRVSIPIKKQSSVSSSSSSEACNDSHFTFTTSRPSIAHLDSAEGGYDLPDAQSHKRSVSNLVPDNIDPTQILSPSKRKAYEKRLERLKVTTSPIARPRSNAPINVVTLDEYANISSPEHSPLSHSVLQDKLKITLPCDEFTRSPKVSSSKRKDSDDTCFEFSEEILFRCTKSALVVDEDGQLPVSPRRVLIPPTITPTNSPKLSSSPRISTDSTVENTQQHGAPKLVYMKEDDPTHKFFGLTFDEPENENWADFPDSSCVNVEKADTECSEKEECSNNICINNQEDIPESSLVIEEPLKEVCNVNDKDFEAEKLVVSCQSPYNIDSLVGLSDCDVKPESTPESSDILDCTTLNDQNNSKKSISGVDSEDALDVRELVIEEKTQIHVDNSDLINSTKSKSETSDIPFEDSPVKSTTGRTVFHATEEYTAVSKDSIPTSTDDVLIPLSNSISADKPISFSEEVHSIHSGEISSQCDQIKTSSNPFSLLDAPTNQGDSSTILPFSPIFSADILQPVATNNQTDSSSHVSLNPFLQDFSTPSEVFGSSDIKDIDIEVSSQSSTSTAVNVESLNLQFPSSQQSRQQHSSLLDVNSSAAQSSSHSSSSDLIDFSSSLDLDLPSKQ